MAGVAGAVVGLASGAQPNIAATVALTDGTTTSRGCRTNFIGFGKGITNQVQSMSDGTVIKDFNATDDTVQEANSLAQLFAPTYTLDVLSWADTTP
jgi:hypothetical protein